MCLEYILPVSGTVKEVLPKGIPSVHFLMMVVESADTDLTFLSALAGMLDR